MTNIYIAGPMSGIREYNKYAFIAMQNLLEDEGRWDKIFNPINSPASRLVQDGEVSGQDAYRLCIALDMKFICEEADAIIMLNGWERSLGARAEHATAICLGLDIYYQPSLCLKQR